MTQYSKINCLNLINPLYVSLLIIFTQQLHWNFSKRYHHFFISLCFPSIFLFLFFILQLNCSLFAYLNFLLNFMPVKIHHSLMTLISHLFNLDSFLQVCKLLLKFQGNIFGKQHTYQYKSIHIVSWQLVIF